jgi:membrane protein required for colicin V production
MNMNSVDLGILGVMAFSCLMGLLRGLTKEVLSLFTWGGSVATAYYFYPSVSGIARAQIANPMIADGVTAVGLFIVCLILFGILTVAISNGVKDSLMGGLDRSLGLAFGIFRGVVVVCAIEIVFSLFISRDHQSETIKQARFITMVRNGSDEIMGFLPLNIRTILLTQIQKAQGIAPLVGNATDLIVQQQVVPQPLPQQNPTQDLLKEMTPPPPDRTKTKAPSPRLASPQDSEKTMENLSSLKPQATLSKSEGVYDSRQQRELERLIETSE